MKILKDDAIYVLHSICQKISKSQQWQHDRKRSMLIPVPKKDSIKECSSHWTDAVISSSSKVMIKIFLARLQHYVNLELPDVHPGFRKGRGTRDQIGSIWWNIRESKGIPEKHLLHWSRQTVWMKLEPIIQSEVSQKEKHQYSILTTKWKILKEMGIPDQRYLSSEKPVCSSKSNKLEPDKEE